MSCKCAKATDEWHGWECEITGGACMFLIPSSKACAERYGEGPDVEHERCEDCQSFYLNEDNKRCCNGEGHLGIIDTPEGIDIIETPIIGDNLVCCGDWKGREKVE